jgi:tetratricopeptide (TPR) repeat protein
MFRMSVKHAHLLKKLQRVHLKIKVAFIPNLIALLALFFWGGAVASDLNLNRQESMEARRTLTQATILLKSGKQEQANTLLKERFPSGPPKGDLAVAYYKILASTPGGWNEARAGLEELSKNNRRNLQYGLALNVLLGSKIETRNQAFLNLANLFKERKVDKQRVLQTWREVLNAQAGGPDLIPFYEAYLSVDPRNAEITGKWMAEKNELAERKRIANDPVLRRRQTGLDLLDKGDIVGAEAPLADTLKSLPNDYLSLGGMGLIRMRQGRYEEAIPYFQRALALNPENAGKWKGLIVTSQYWSKIHQAEVARDAGNYSLALERIRSAIELDPQGAEAIAVLGTIESDQGNKRDAEKHFRETLILEADNGIAIRGLVQIMIDSAKWSEAMSLLNSQAPANSPEGARYNYLRVKILGAQADALIAKGENQAAIGNLTEALRTDPQSPWLRFKLAGIYRQMSQLDKASQVMKEGLRISPNDPEMINSDVLFLISVDRFDDALSVMRKSLKNPSLASNALRLTYADLLNRLERDDELDELFLTFKRYHFSGEDGIKYQRIQIAFNIRQALKNGDSNRAISLLKQALQLDPDEVWLRLDLARLYAKTHQPDMGKLAFEEFLAKHPKSIDGIYAYSLFLSGLEENLEALKLLERIPKAERTAKIVNLQRRIWVDMQIEQVKTLDGRGENAQAISHLERIEQEVGPDPNLLSSLAATWASIGMQERGDALFQKILSQNQSLPIDWHLYYANYLLNHDQEMQFRKEMQFLSAQKLSAEQARDLEGLKESSEIQDVTSLIRNGDVELAKQKLDPLLKAEPDNYKIKYLNGQILKGEGFYDLAIDIEQHALAQSPAPLASVHSLSTLKQMGGSSGVSIFQIEPPIVQPSSVSSGSPYQYKQLAELIDMRTNWIDSAIDYLSLSGTPGQSSYRATEIPLEWKMPLRAGERLTFRADQVNINAGSIDASNSYQVSTFGSMAACSVNCPTSFSNQSASGTALNLGYENQNFKADLGTTPVGFLTQNWIGGLKQKGDIGPIGYSLELSRRPMTSTLLSYAGTRDPVTGSIWGGVVATGATVGLSLDQGGALGGWTYFRARSLVGNNVQSNSDNQFMVGLNWRVINETDRQLSSGLTGMLWGFKQNDGEFTYGQGGYYSPQSYRAITLPLNYSQRFARFSFVLGGSVTSNWSRTDAAPYFPTNGAYQAAAGNPYYSASSGPGSAYSLLGGWEYQLTPSVFVGNRLKLERSPYYAPNSFTLYIRIDLDGAAPNPVPLVTQPVLPTSRF